MNISVIIPAYNEERSLANVIRDLPRELLDEIIVVNNGSTDRTAAVAEEAGCRVIHEPQKGYGQACLSGIAALKPATDIVVFLDADYSDHPEQLSRLIDPIIRDGYDFVIGSRALGERERGAMTPQAFWGNRLACFLMKSFWDAPYTDLGPFRAISYAALKKIQMTDRDFGWTIEMQIKALRHGLKVREVAVDYRRRIGQSKISGTLRGTVLAGYKILTTIYRLRLRYPYRKSVTVTY